MMKFDYSLIDSVHCDRLNMRYEKVGADEFAEILTVIEKLACENKIVNYRYEEKTSSIEYRHNIYIQTTFTSEGAMFIGWQRNNEKMKENCHYDLKLEFNPSKTFEEKTYEDGKLISSDIRQADLYVYKALGRILDMKINRVIEFDMAIDLKVAINELISISRKGRFMDLYKGTRYFGTKHKDLYLKIYDKTRERKEKANEVIDGNLTRIEFTIKPNNGGGILFHDLRQYMLDIDKYYSFALYNDKALTDNMKSNILCLLHGLRQFKDFHKDNKKKILKEIDEKLVTISINEIANHYWNQLLEPIREWSYSNSEEQFDGLDGFMKLIKYNNNEQHQHYINEHFKDKK